MQISPLRESKLAIWSDVCVCVCVIAYTATVSVTAKPIRFTFLRFHFEAAIAARRLQRTY